MSTRTSEALTKLCLDVSCLEKQTDQDPHCKEDGNDHESIQSNSTPTQDTLWESEKNTRKHHTQKSQEARPFSAGDHKAACKNMIIIFDKKNNGQ